MKRAMLFFLCAMLFAGCRSGIVNDKKFIRMMSEDLKSRSEVLEAAGVCLDQMNISSDERCALEFLYAYMPLGDIVNKTPEYYLEQYTLTKEAVQRMPWGKRIPEREMRHFVLPVRVNNESLDDARSVFFEELAPRVEGLSMYDAVLEVNHWCHEKAVYMPSDRRTSSPLATVKTAYGRCGEESTLLVAALRSVAIPARQVYTPRWAHTDSNHAWVEAWVDGEWYFLGACEPEPVLDLGWFNAPASRGMLMHTKVFGRYDGPEEVVGVTPNHTEINVILNYAPEAASVAVNVVDADGNPVEGAKVEYKIYNYSEFNTVAYKTTDVAGHTALTAGLGDMMIYASKDGKFGFAKVTYGKDEAVTIKLEYEEGSRISHIEMEVVPPVENARLPEVSDEQRAANTRRMEYEDSLRNAYVATFYDLPRSNELAESCHLDASRVAKIMVASRGNHSEIESFIRKAVSAGLGEVALDLLETLTEKDLRDTPVSVLADHLDNRIPGGDDNKVLCPRVETELLTPYRASLKSLVPQSLVDSLRQDPATLVDWCRRNLSLHDEMSLRYVQLEPVRVWETRLADKISREIFFVAMCRTFGVTAWRDTVTGAVKYEKDGVTYDVDFDADKQSVMPQGKLQLRFEEISLLDDPKYKTHFTLSRFEDGSFQLQNFTGSWETLFREPLLMDCGYYMLTSGLRMSGGDVCADVAFFTVKEGETTVVDLKLRDSSDHLRVIGSFDSEMKYMSVSSADAADVENMEQKSVLQTTGRGYFAVALVDYGTEPTNHAFMDISAVKEELEAWGRPILVIFATDEDCRKFRADHFDLPSTVCFGVDINGKMRNMIASEMKLDKGGSLPLILVADTFNRVVFFSQGYSIGLGEKLVKTSKAL